MMKKNEQNNDKKKTWIFLLVFFLLSVACIIFGVLCLSLWQNAWVNAHWVLLSVLYSVLVCGLCATACWLCLTGKETWMKTLLSAFVLLLFALVVLYLLQKTGFFRVVNSTENLQAYLQKAGAWMPFLYVLLQYLQVVLLPIPSVVSTVAGVALFGAFWTTVYSLIGILLGSLTAFFIGRKLGNRAVTWMIGEETLEKWQKKLKKKDNIVLTLAFLLPFFPDDVLCFLAGLSSMTTRYFVIVIVIARVLGVAGTCYSIDFIPFTTWWGITIWVGFFLVIVATFIIVYKKMDVIQKWVKKLTKKEK